MDLNNRGTWTPEEAVTLYAKIRERRLEIEKSATEYKLYEVQLNKYLIDETFTREVGGFVGKEHLVTRTETLVPSVTDKDALLTWYADNQASMLFSMQIDKTVAGALVKSEQDLPPGLVAFPVHKLSIKAL